MTPPSARAKVGTMVGKKGLESKVAWAVVLRIK